MANLCNMGSLQLGEKKNEVLVTENIVSLCLVAFWHDVDVWDKVNEDQIKSPVERNFQHSSRPAPGAHLVFCAIGTAFFMGVKWAGSGIYQHPRLAPRLKKQ
jgi:hypothetical protein